jgi:hypothetical protein
MERSRMSGSGRQSHDERRFEPVQDLVPAISLRENERSMQIGAGWNPHYCQRSDRSVNCADRTSVSA